MAGYLLDSIRIIELLNEAKHYFIAEIVAEPSVLFLLDEKFPKNIYELAKHELLANYIELVNRYLNLTAQNKVLLLTQIGFYIMQFDQGDLTVPGVLLVQSGGIDKITSSVKEMPSGDLLYIEERRQCERRESFVYRFSTGVIFDKFLESNHLEWSQTWLGKWENGALLVNMTVDYRYSHISMGQSTAYKDKDGSKVYGNFQCKFPC